MEDVFAWYIKNYGSEVNIFVDHIQIVQLEGLCQGIWGKNKLWGYIITFYNGEKQIHLPSSALFQIKIPLVFFILRSYTDTPK